MIALALALGSSLAWGVSDFMGGMAGRRLPLLMVLLVSQAVGLYLALVTLAYFPEPFPGGRAALMATASGVADAIGLWALYRGLATSAMGIVAPVAATGAVLPVGYGLATGHPGSTALVVGVAMAIAGVALVALQPSDGKGSEKANAGAGVALGLLAALGFGLGFLLLGLASESEVGWSVLLNRLGSVGIVAVAVAATWTPLRFRGDDFPALAVIGILDALAITMFAWASTHGSLGLVAALGSLYPVVTALLARALLNERLGVLRRIGAMAAVGGALMLSAAAEPVPGPEPAADVASSAEDRPARRLVPIERLTRPAAYGGAPGSRSTGS
jgi:drug/metabolite transporter (DMT)-like permease